MTRVGSQRHRKKVVIIIIIVIVEIVVVVVVVVVYCCLCYPGQCWMFDFKSFELQQGVTGRHSCTFRMT